MQQVTRDELQSQLATAGLERYAAVIAGHARLAIAINRTVVQDETEIAIGESKLGGRPDVPAGFEWPHWNDLPLTFLAQFRLSDVKPYDVDNLLPGTGMLYFFFEADEIPYGDAHQRDGHRVFYFPDERSAKLTRVEHPTANGQFGQIEALHPAKLSFSIQWTLPTLSYLDNSLSINNDYWSDDQYDAYDEVRSRLNHRLLGHQLLGQPSEVQGDVRYEAREWSRNENIPYSDSAVDDESKLNEWLLLFQMDSDDGDNSLYIMWGDVGMLYFMITRNALSSRQFDKTWCIMQCS